MHERSDPGRPVRSAATPEKSWVHCGRHAFAFARISLNIGKENAGLLSSGTLRGQSRSHRGAALRIRNYGNATSEPSLHNSHAPKEPWVYRGGSDHIGAGNWGEHGHFQRGQFCAAATASVQG